MSKYRHSPIMKSKRRKVKTRESCTQTEVFKDWPVSKETRVVLEKLSQSKIRSVKTSNKRHVNQEASDHLSVQNPSLLPVLNRPSSISKPPGSYRIFVKPITNNERANSTLVNDTAEDYQQQQQVLTGRCNQNKKVRFVKPGPLSYKQRVLKELKEDMNVPIMLSEQPELNEEGRNSLNLDTILEQINENGTATPELDLNFDMNSFNLEPHNMAVQTGVSINISPSNVNNDDGVVEDRSKSEETDNPSQEKAQPKTIRMDFRGITTTITSRSTSQNFNGSSSSDNDDAEGLPKDTKYVKIKAHTVHIHNHFYNSQ